MSDVTTGSNADEAMTSPLNLPHVATECSKCFTELQHDHAWWHARPAQSRLVGLVVSREGMPSIVEQRDELTRFGVPIEGFRHPAPEILESWSDRLARFIATLKSGDVLVVANVHALGRDRDEETRTISELRRRGVMVKVLSTDHRHLADAQR
ncbi:recombinase family protein [Microbacterium sp. GXF6406]